MNQPSSTQQNACKALFYANSDLPRLDPEVRADLKAESFAWRRKLAAHECMEFSNDYALRNGLAVVTENIRRCAAAFQDVPMFGIVGVHRIGKSMTMKLLQQVTGHPIYHCDLGAIVHEGRSHTGDQLLANLRAGLPWVVKIPNGSGGTLDPQIVEDRLKGSTEHPITLLDSLFANTDPKHIVVFDEMTLLVEFYSEQIPEFLRVCRGVKNIQIGLVFHLNTSNREIMRQNGVDPVYLSGAASTKEVEAMLNRRLRSSGVHMTEDGLAKVMQVSGGRVVEALLLSGYSILTAQGIDITSEHINNYLDTLPKQFWRGRGVDRFTSCCHELFKRLDVYCTPQEQKRLLAIAQGDKLPSSKSLFEDQALLGGGLIHFDFTDRQLKISGSILQAMICDRFG
jgi:hypothetical protein